MTTYLSIQKFAKLKTENMDPNAKQLAVERLKQSTNVLVTVSTNPSVDDLAAAIGFSLLLGKLDKHASAVFSGKIPPAIEFLEPNKRFDQDVAGLRDFIIALDKEKADKLRYKVEDNVVKIFITPYKAKITQDDLQFSEGDFNVDAVVALNVAKREDLDNAIKAHGRILHDATVITIGAGGSSSNLGSIDWQDPAASSLCEMLVSISESFGSGLLDEQISTAFLTGIVAATERFSNTRTTPKVMTMSAQLMAAGANQQLISTNLTPIKSSGPSEQVKQPHIDESDPSQIKIQHEGTPLPPQLAPEPLVPMPPPEPTLPPPEPLPPSPPPASTPSSVTEQPSPNQPPPGKSLKQLEDEISQLAAPPPKANKPSDFVPPPPMIIKPTESQPGQEHSSQTPPSLAGGPKPILDSYTSPQDSVPKISTPKGYNPREIDDELTMGGTFNATSEQAHEESVSDLKKSVNSTLLNHPTRAFVSDSSQPPASNAHGAADSGPLPAAASFLANTSQPEEHKPAPLAPGIDVEDARRAVEDAMNAQPFDPSGHPLASVGSQPLPQDSAETPTTNQDTNNPAQSSVFNPVTNKNDSASHQFQLPGKQ